MRLFMLVIPISLDLAVCQNETTEMINQINNGTYNSSSSIIQSKFESPPYLGFFVFGFLFLAPCVGLVAKLLERYDSGKDVNKRRFTSIV